MTDVAVAVRAWCRDKGHAITGISWEHYGHWHEDPNDLETAVCYVVADAR